MLKFFFPPVWRGPFVCVEGIGQRISQQQRWKINVCLEIQTATRTGSIFIVDRENNWVTRWRSA